MLALAKMLLLAERRAVEGARSARFVEEDDLAKTGCEGREGGLRSELDDLFLIDEAGTGNPD